MSWTIRYYQTGRGDEVVKKFINDQDNQTQAKIIRLLEALRSYGPDLGMPYARFLGHGLYELRVRGENEVRIFYVLIISDQTVVLLHAFRKRSQKLPQKELDLARQRQKELT